MVDFSLFWILESTELGNNLIQLKTDWNQNSIGCSLLKIFLAMDQVATGYVEKYISSSSSDCIPCSTSKRFLTPSEVVASIAR